jgi:hypothetical protein
MSAMGILVYSQVVTKYINIMEKHIQYHKIESKINDLHNQAKDNIWNDESTTRYERLDNY